MQSEYPDAMEPPVRRGLSQSTGSNPPEWWLSFTVQEAQSAPDYLQRNIVEIKMRIAVLNAVIMSVESDSLEVMLATIMGNLINDEEIEPAHGILLTIVDARTNYEKKTGMNVFQ